MMKLWDENGTSLNFCTNYAAKKSVFLRVDTTALSCSFVAHEFAVSDVISRMIFPADAGRSL